MTARGIDWEFAAATFGTLCFVLLCLAVATAIVKELVDLVVLLRDRRRERITRAEAMAVQRRAAAAAAR